MHFSFKIDMDKKLQRAMGVTVHNGKIYPTAKKSEMINDVKKEFSLIGPVKVKQAILQDVSKGISPVQGKGKFKKYSDSYKKAIKKGRYVGKTVGTKGISPVNLRLSGGLTRSLKAFTAGRGSFFKLVIDWQHFLAVIHNTLGASKSKIIRRMLPTNANEKFNKHITDVLIKEIKKAVDKVVKKIT